MLAVEELQYSILLRECPSRLPAILFTQLIHQKDKFTTNFYLPDGSYGTIVSGNYMASDGSSANLLSGAYTLANGTSGDIYKSSNSPAKPNTSTLTLPKQFTGSGVGNVIPASALGGVATYTITIPGTTIPATILPAHTISPLIVGTTTIPTATTEPGTTIPGTTRAATTVTVTSFIPLVASSTTTTASTGGADVGGGFRQSRTARWGLFLALLMGV